MNSIFAKISSRENISTSLFVKISARENNVLYSIYPIPSTVCGLVSDHASVTHAKVEDGDSLELCNVRVEISFLPNKRVTLGTPPSRVVALYMDVNLTKLAFTVDVDSRHSQVDRLNHMCRAFRNTCTEYCDMSEVFLLSQQHTLSSGRPNRSIAPRMAHC